MNYKFILMSVKSINFILLGLLTIHQLCANGRPTTKTCIRKATILHTMDPVHPGDIELLTGDWPLGINSSSTGVEVEIVRMGKYGLASANKSNGDLEWQRIHPLEVSEQSLKFKIPGNWTMGVFACRVVPSSGATPFESSQIVLLNAPDPWWLQGDGGASNASPGGWLRIFGKSLNFEQSSQVNLECKGKKIILNARGAKDKGGYTLCVDLPENFPPGEYIISVHNGFGGKDAWKNAGLIKIYPVQKWKQDIFNIRDFREGVKT
jgi:hypothetical protein